MHFTDWCLSFLQCESEVAQTLLYGAIQAPCIAINVFLNTADDDTSVQDFKPWGPSFKNPYYGRQRQNPGRQMSTPLSSTIWQEWMNPLCCDAFCCIQIYQSGDTCGVMELIVFHLQWELLEVNQSIVYERVMYSNFIIQTIWRSATSTETYRCAWKVSKFVWPHYFGLKKYFYALVRESLLFWKILCYYPYQPWKWT